MQVVPNYYHHFKCIAGACKHSCCIGWEIDIDEDSAAFYRTVPGEIGSRLREKIDWTGTPHFILGERERCPFLNRENLCDLILTLGEERLCGICAQHPRFRNELPGRVEVGLGLCCEAAARLILSQKDPVRLIGAKQSEDEIIRLRDEILCILQDRDSSIVQRVEKMLGLCDTAFPEKTPGEWAAFLLSLERLDEGWSELLLTLKMPADTEGFDLYMQDRQIEYEQLLIYFIYRHFATAYDLRDAASRACFAALGYLILHALGAALWTRQHSFSFEDQVELARIFSSEIEYSEENLNRVLDELYL